MKPEAPKTARENDAPPDAPGYDTAGQPITPSRLRRAMRLNIAVGIGGTAWHAVCGPGMVLTVFFRNHMGASDAELGLLVSLSLLAAPFNLLAIFIYGRLRTRKVYWGIAGTIHRLYAFVLAGVSLYVARGGATGLGIKIILGAAAVSWVLTVASTSGWWSWMADLVPAAIRATFFGRRGAVVRGFNMVWVFALTAALDAFEVVDILYVYAVIFTIAGIVGTADILIHCFIPEPARHPDEPRVGWKEFTEPLRSRNFIGFALVMGLWGLSVGVFTPFIWPHVTAEDEIGAPQKWIGIAMVINQLASIATVTFWGVAMDRFGRKPVVLIGSLWAMMRIGYVLATPTNYVFVIPMLVLAQGILAPGAMHGTQQLMLTLTPSRNRTAYVSWYSAVVGILAAGGPLLGGLLKESLGGWESLWLGWRVTGFHVVGLASLAMCALAWLVMTRIREGQEKPVGYVVSRLFTPGAVRTFMNLGSIGFAHSSERAAKALRTLDGGAGTLALADTVTRLDDPDATVREEAARALGRIGSEEAVDALIERLRDPQSTIRVQAARALGQIGDARAVPALVEGLKSPSVELQEVCAQALGEIGGRDSVKRLKVLVTDEQHNRTERVLVSGAEAVSKHGIVEAAWNILPRLHETPNPVLRRQLAVAMGNLLGRPGEFYAFLTGEQAREGARLGRLFRAARRALATLETSATRPFGEKGMLAAELERLRGLMEGQSYRSALEGLIDLGRRAAEHVIGRSAPDDDLMLEYALARDARLGTGYWFLTEARRRMGRIDDPELLHIDALLALYFLSVFPTTGS